MKPRFSILTLFGAVAFVALSEMSVIYPESGWRYAPFLIWFSAMLWAITGIASPGIRNTRNGAFSIGFVLTSLTYSVGAWAEYEWPSRTNGLGQFTPHLPHWYLFGLFVKLRGAPEQDASIQNALDAQFGLNLVAVTCALFLAGILGGCLSVWRYHIDERRAKERA